MPLGAWIPKQNRRPARQPAVAESEDKLQRCGGECTGGQLEGGKRPGGVTQKQVTVPAPEQSGDSYGSPKCNMAWPVRTGGGSHAPGAPVSGGGVKAGCQPHPSAGFVFLLLL